MRLVILASLLVLCLEYPLGYSTIKDSPLFEQLPQTLCNSELLTLLYEYEPLEADMGKVCSICKIRMGLFDTTAVVHNGKLVHRACKHKTEAKADKDKVVVMFGKIARVYELQ